MEKFISEIEGRLDKILSSKLSHSRNQIEKLIKDGLVKINSKIVKKRSFKIKINDEIEYRFVEATKEEAIDINFDVDIIYEDEYILVINKPSGLVVHKAPSVKEATLVDWLIHKGISLSTISGEERHGIVHRIDRETTGALVVAKTNKAHQNLSEQLQDKSMGRYYLAIIDYPLKDDTIIEAPIGRSPTNRLKMAINNNGKYAKSHFKRLIEGRDNLELILAKLYTGRTHQIRVHLNSMGRHILGDEMYGFKVAKNRPRVQLHAYLLYLTHPITGKKMEFVAPIFDDMKDILSTKFNIKDVKDIINSKRLIEKF
ncbi:Ribosomal large subunit pseudouridine synthase D [hydrothermal vent metagenome]|uniref:Ribosomal large subunit pseudouridine synthase D n=1 Tax=hydrothermal vent metagenome TaxID=652676 RepID=A0A1W1EL38_9ZZZZ